MQRGVFYFCTQALRAVVAQTQAFAAPQLRFGAVLPVPAAILSVHVRQYAKPAKDAKGGKADAGAKAGGKVAKIAKAAKPGEKIAKISKGGKRATEEEEEELLDEEARQRAALITKIEDLTEEELKARQKVVGGIVQHKCTCFRERPQHGV